MKLDKYKKAVERAKGVLKESASTVDALNREMSNNTTQTFVLTGAAKKFAKIKKELATRISTTAQVTLQGDNVIVTAPRAKSVEYLLKRFGTVTQG